jgi:hypothetical protein
VKFEKLLKLSNALPFPEIPAESSQIIRYLDPVEKVIFCRLIKNAQMQGGRNPEE